MKEVGVEQTEVAVDKGTQKLAENRLVQLSYQTALTHNQERQGLAGKPWLTWLLVIGTSAIWCFTAYKTALATGAHGTGAILRDIVNNAITVQDRDNDALTQILVRYGAKDNTLILHGQYWRFITPIFLHVNALHVGLNMLNLLALGVFLERIMGHLRFLLIYSIAGVISLIASFYFMPQEVSVGASGAIFGLVGAYSIFVLTHRKAFPRGGLTTILWLIFIIGLNLGIGLYVPNVDNYAHLGGLVGGCILGWWFMPMYRWNKKRELIDVHSLLRRWPFVLLAIVGTLILAMTALHLSGG
jgi:membrane associated rhomboid family serine protease